MAMQRNLWSLNALSNELRMDRRTLAKRLEDLPPARTKQVGGRVEKSWHLADVLAHLKEDEDGSPGQPPNYLRGYAEASVQHFVYWLTEEWGRAWSGLLHTETKLTDDQICRLFKLQYVLLIHYASQYVTEDVFNALHTEQTGFSLDGLISKHEGCVVESSPPLEPKFQLPSVIKALMSEAERGRYERYIRK